MTLLEYMISLIKKGRSKENKSIFKANIVLIRRAFGYYVWKLGAKFNPNRALYSYIDSIVILFEPKIAAKVDIINLNALRT